MTRESKTKSMGRTTTVGRTRIAPRRRRATAASDDTGLILALGTAVTSILGNLAQAENSAVLRRQRDELMVLVRRLEKAHAVQTMKLAEARQQMEAWRKDSESWRKEAAALAASVEREERAVNELTKTNAELTRALAEATAASARADGGRP